MKTFEGKYAIVRTYSAGVFFGIVSEVDLENRSILLLNARRIWKWEGAFTLTEVSEYGIKDGKISIPKDEHLIVGFIEILPASQKAIENLKSFKSYEI